MGMFKLLRGQHVSGRGATRVKYAKGDLIQSNLELDKIFGTKKFERLHSVKVPAKVGKVAPIPEEEIVEDEPVEEEVHAEQPTQTTVEDPYGLKTMTKAELVDFAEGEEIEVSPAARKDQIYKVIVDTLASRRA